MRVRFHHAVVWFCVLQACFALNPRKRFTQYTHRVWTQAEGLPQDTVRVIAQTPDGYLWIGTDEGLARFDGYHFTVYNKNEGKLPSSAITALCAARDGTLWIGTTGGLTAYRGGKFTTYAGREGLPNSLITSIAEGPDGTIWVATGLYLSRLKDGKFTTYGGDVPVQGIRAVLPEAGGDVWVAGYAAVGRLEHNRLVAIASGGQMNDNIATGIMRDRRGEIVVTGTQGVFIRGSDGRWTRYTSANGLPDILVRTAVEDREGNLWVGTNGGLARRAGDTGSFVDLSGAALRPHDWVWSIFEDREGALWVGTNNGLHQFLDEPFTVFTTAEGLPSDQPTTVFEDHTHRIWVGFHDSGLGYFENGRFVSQPGVPSREIFGIGETRGGDLLVASRGGLSRVRAGRVVNTFAPRDNVGRRNVFDTMEDSRGRVWAATNQGLLELSGDRVINRPVPGGTVLNDAIVVLTEGRDGSIWAGTYAQGLWRYKDGKAVRYTVAEGLPSDLIRSLYEDRAGTLWIGTFNGGLAAFKDERFHKYTSADGLASDNIAQIIDDRSGSLWLATTRGIVRIGYRDLQSIFRGDAKSMTPTFYGVADGLRSAQCAPGYPTAGGGIASSDGRLWFPTGYGLATLDPRRASAARRPPPTRLRDMLIDGRAVDVTNNMGLDPDVRRIEFRYAAVELSAPESLRYRYRLEGVDRDWVHADARRVADYNNLAYGHHRFTVAATRDGITYGPAAVFDFYREPHVWETRWFRWALVFLAAFAIWGGYRLRLRQVQRGYALVLAERARIAREIHDTLAQGFVGIASQLDAVSMMLKTRPDAAAQHLELARRMSQHSLTEARRSIMDLRAEELEQDDFAGALRDIAKLVTAGTPVRTEVDMDPAPPPLPKDTEHQVLRITQEAVANAVKHGAPRNVKIRLARNNGRLNLRVHDDGCGFDTANAFLTAGGHFGLLGMRERAERIGGELTLESAPGQGTTIEVSIPLP